MCNCTLSLKFLVCSKDRAYSENRNQRMRQVVAYRGLKDIGKSLTVRVRKWSRSLIYRGGGSLQEVPTVRLWLGKFWCFGLAVAYGRRSLTRAGRTWRFDLYPLLQLLIPPIMQFFSALQLIEGSWQHFFSMSGKCFMKLFWHLVFSDCCFAEPAIRQSFFSFVWESTKLWHWRPAVSR